jgi:type I restriction enzyme S subunit
MGKEKLPDGWRWSTLKKECIINPRKPQLQVDDRQETSFVPMEAVDGDLGIISEAIVVPYQKVKKGYTYFEENDILFAKITPCMQNKKSAIAKNLINNFGFGSTEFHVLRCKELVIPEWIYYFVRNQQFVNEAKANFTGAVGQQRVPKSFLENYPLLVPPLEVQQEIVAKIGKQLIEFEKLKEECNKKLLCAKDMYESFLSTYLDKSKGNFRSFHFSDLFEIVMGQSPKGDSYSKDNNGYPLLNGPTEFGDVHPIPFQWTNKPTKICQKGDVLVCVRGNTTGRTNIADQKYCIGRGLAAIRPKNENLNVSVILHVLSYIMEELLKNSSGSTFPNLTRSVLENFEFNLPTKIDSINEVTQILDGIELECNVIKQSVNVQLEAINQLPASILNEVFGKYEIPEKV